MTTATRDRDLLFDAEGLLDPDEAADMAERLEADPALRDRLIVLLAATADALPAAVADGAPPAWRLPPPGLGWRADLGAPAVMDAGRSADPRVVRQGRRVQLHLEPVPDPDAGEVLVLHRLPERGWSVVFPRTPEERTPLSRLRRAEDGRWQVDLVASGPAGPQRWAVVLAPLALAGDWDAPEAARWLPLQAALARGEVSAATVHLEVVAG